MALQSISTKRSLARIRAKKERQMNFRESSVLPWLLCTCLAALLSAAEVKAETGERLYKQNCAACHHPDRIGLLAPPLLPPFLKRSSDEKLAKTIRDGLPATQMPAFPGLSEEDIAALIELIRKPGKVSWSDEQIASSSKLSSPETSSATPFKDLQNLTAVVERGKSKVWLMEDEEVLDKFSFSGVHGGIKFTPDGSKLFVPSRDGWIGRYDINKGFAGKVRAGVYLRNMALSRDGKRLLVACWLPSSISILDSDTLKPLKIIEVEGKISAIYDLHSKDQAVFTFRDVPQIGIVDTNTMEVSYTKLDEPLEDFFIDPFDRYLVGTSRHGKAMRVVDLKDGSVVFEQEVDGLPHLFSAAVWYQDGEFFFATSHMRLPYVSVWRMYDWALVKKVPTGGAGYFVRTHGATPYLWVDRGNDELVLIDKQDLAVKTITPEPGLKVLHTEFSGDGRVAYVSLFDKEGQLALYDAATLKDLKRIPASLPVGKYNFINKQRRYDPVMLGEQVFMKKCWGCHHPTKEAFGPSFKTIAETRTESEIWAQIVNPEASHSGLGYKRNSMPRIQVSFEEVKALMSFIKESTHAENI
jgi:mono/diheme cytochrome c family protein